VVCVKISADNAVWRRCDIEEYVCGLTVGVVWGPVDIYKGVAINFQPEEVSRIPGPSLLGLEASPFFDVCDYPRSVVHVVPAINWNVCVVSWMRIKEVPAFKANPRFLYQDDIYFFGPAKL
jgi:hypothetical protein